MSSADSKPPTSFGRVFSVTWKVVLSLALIPLIIMAVLAFIGGLTTRAVEQVEQRPDDAAQLLSRCGTPLKDDSTAYDSPRPPLVTRFIEYKANGTRLKFVYVPNSGHAGDPPPYHWKLMLVANAKTNRLVSRAAVSGILPCFAEKKP